MQRILVLVLSLALFPGCALLEGEDEGGGNGSGGDGNNGNSSWSPDEYCAARCNYEVNCPDDVYTPWASYDECMSSSCNEQVYSSGNYCEGPDYWAVIDCYDQAAPSCDGALYTECLLDYTWFVTC